MHSYALARGVSCGAAASTSGRGAVSHQAGREVRVARLGALPARLAARHRQGIMSTINISTARMPPRNAFQSGGGNNSSSDKTNEADAAAVADFLVACSPRVQAALRAIAGDPQGALRQYARDPEVMAALGTVLSRGMAPGRRAAIERLLAATADEAQAAAEPSAGAAAAARRRKQEEAEKQQQQEQQQRREVPAPGKVVAAMFSDPELARLMADPEVKAALSAARGALLGGWGDAGARRALEGRGPKVDRAMELLEARLGRFVGSADTVDV